MNNQLFDIAGRLISCIVTVLVFFRFFDARYKRLHHSKIVYASVKIICCVLNLCVYLFNRPVVNVLFWILAIIFISRFLYYGEKTTRITYYLINISFFFAYSICESIGCILISTGIHILNISQIDYIISFVYTISGSTSGIILYYLVLQKLFVNDKMRKLSSVQYIIYAVLTIYVLVNIGSILFILQHELTDGDYIFLFLNAVFVIILNLYMFYLLDIFAENKNLKYKLALYEKQAKSNYGYYTKQLEGNKKALKVIHDIRKHIHVMEELKQSQITLQLQGYTDSFEEMIAPLIIKQYSDSAILNIIINDKAEYCAQNNIQFDVDIQPIDIAFMKPIDITTIFGNLLDNAIEACEKAEEKKISLKIYPFNGLIYIQLSNTYSGTIQWSLSGRPRSPKGEGHGIGLENVENALQQYNGNIQFSASDELFLVEIMFSKS